MLDDQLDIQFSLPKGVFPTRFL